MVQFNLLPDIKIQYLKARRQKRLVLLVSVVTIIASVSILGILASITFVLQKKNISDLSADIKQASDELRQTPDLDKMLTVQNQLKVMPGLHDAKPVVSRLFGYVTQSTPTEASISRLTTDFVQQSISMTGSAASLETVNTFADTLKFTTYHTELDAKTEKPAFNEVVLSSFARDNNGTTYTLTFKFDPAIFSQADEVTLTVPKKVTTRSQTEQPTALFSEGTE